jgi:hypothetical protein
MIDNKWYLLETTITYTGASDFAVALRFSDLGAKGTMAPVLLDSYE